MSLTGLSSWDGSWSFNLLPAWAFPPNSPAVWSLILCFYKSCDRGLTARNTHPSMERQLRSLTNSSVKTPLATFHWKPPLATNGSMCFFVVGLPLPRVGSRARVYIEDHMPHVYIGISQANKLLSKACSVFLPWQLHLHNTCSDRIVPPSTSCVEAVTPSMTTLEHRALKEAI